MKSFLAKIPYASLLLVGALLIVGAVGCQAVATQQSATQTLAPESADLTNAADSDAEAQISAGEGQGEGVEGDDPNHCLVCHADQQALMDTAAPVAVLESENSGEGCGGEVAPLEPWEKVLIDEGAFLGTVHGKISCQECHQGEQSPDKETAHTDLIPHPSDDPQPICGECHPDLVSAAENSLHATLDGYWTALASRGVPQAHPAAEEMFGNHCAGCHASCGDCHVSRPTSVGGGLVDGHLFQAEPSMTENCTACHGSRIGNEYLGIDEGLQADVHFRQGGMTCVDCHTGHEMHGTPANCQDCHPGPEASQVAAPEHRYDGLQEPSCESCHAPVAAGNDGIFMHEQHSGTLSCQVCHSVSYTNCDGCHVSLSEQTGEPIYATEGSYLGFFIGKNTLQSYARPYVYVPVRHVPISRTSFDYYETGLVSDFSGRATWVYTTPHNIQRITPQVASCSNCHDNPDLFLTADKVAPDELDANRDVIVDEIPPSPY